MRQNRRGFLPLLVSLILASAASAQQKTLAPPEFIQWLPVSDAEKQQKAPVVDPAAGAEILLWRVHVVDEITGQDLQRVLYCYIRVKVFDEKGKAAVTTIDLPYRSPGAILEVAGRTLKGDGSVVDLDSKTVYRRDLVKVGGIKEKVVSFALPGVEPGAILEYRWKQTQDDNRFRYLRLNFARELPVQKVTYFVKPLSSDYVATDRMFLAPFNCRPTPMAQTNDGWNETSVTNVAASRDEPFSPSKPNLEPWALLYYREGGSNDPKKYWSDVGKKRYNLMKSALKASDDLKAAAAKINAATSDADQKIALMVAFVRESLRDFFDLTDSERNDFIKKLPKDRDRTSAEIMKSGVAFDEEMNVVLAALASQAGFDARPALVANRNEMDFEPEGLADLYFLNDVAMAIKVNGNWKIFDVSNRSLKPGMMPANSEGVFALVTDSKAPEFVRTPITPPDQSAERRTATLNLDAEGTLEGDVKEVYSGHRAALFRGNLDGDSVEQQAEWLKERMSAIFPGSQISAIDIQNLENAQKDLIISYHLVAPRFGQVTGRRILFEPVAFRRAEAARFPGGERKFPVLFRYGWMESDEVKITFPDGYALENAENPGNLDFGEPGAYKLEMRSDGKSLMVNRELTFGNKALLLFAVNQYPILKQIFDTVHVRDTTSLSLRGN